MTNARLERYWPDVERRLLRALRAMHVPRERGEDFVQEAALRVMRERIRYVDSDDLYRWAWVVVRNLVIDAWRRDKPLISDDTLPERPCHVDVANVVERRLALEAVLEKWPQLSGRTRLSIVLAVEEQAVAVEEARALNAARYRGRQILRAATKGLLGWTGLASLWRGMRSPRVAAAAALSVAVVLSLLPVIVSPPSDGDAAAAPAATGFRLVVTVPGSLSEVVTTQRDELPRPVEREPSSQPEPSPVSVIRAGAPGTAEFIYDRPSGTGPLICFDPGPPIPGEKCPTEVVETLVPVTSPSTVAMP